MGASPKLARITRWGLELIDPPDEIKKSGLPVTEIVGVGPGGGFPVNPPPPVPTPVPAPGEPIHPSIAKSPVMVNASSKIFSKNNR